MGLNSLRAREVHYNTNMQKCKDLCNSNEWCDGFEILGGNKDEVNSDVCTLKEKIDGYDKKYNYFQKVKVNEEKSEEKSEEKRDEKDEEKKE
jgi:hypothetical protein